MWRTAITTVGRAPEIESAGFREISELQKGCDNFWHGKAVKDGAAVRVALSPQGKVSTEND